MAVLRAGPLPSGYSDPRKLSATGRGQGLEFGLGNLCRESERGGELGGAEKSQALEDCRC